MEQAHNGYLDVYLQLGLVGVVALAAFLLGCCSIVRKAFLCDFDWGLFGMAFLLMVASYNLSETAFFDVYLGVAMVVVPVALSAKAPAQREIKVAPNQPLGFPTSPARLDRGKAAYRLRY